METFQESLFTYGDLIEKKPSQITPNGQRTHKKTKLREKRII
jgi:hypothetical protein